MHLRPIEIVKTYIAYTHVSSSRFQQTYARSIGCSSLLLFRPATNDGNSYENTSRTYIRRRVAYVDVDTMYSVLVLILRWHWFVIKVSGRFFSQSLIVLPYYFSIWRNGVSWIGSLCDAVAALQIGMGFYGWFIYYFLNENQSVWCEWEFLMISWLECAELMVCFESENVLITKIWTGEKIKSNNFYFSMKPKAFPIIGVRSC